MQLFKKKKLDYVKNFAESISFKTNSKRVWNIFKILKKSSIKVYHLFDKDALNEKSIKCLDKIAPPWVSIEDHTPSCQQNEFFDKPFSFLEFNTALNTGKENSSPGLDGIDYEVLQMLPIKYKLLLLDIYNEMYDKSEFPNAWKDSLVHFIDKPDGNGVRPISLTSCLSKTFERLLKNRLEWWLEKNNIIPKNQSGFRKGRSCIDNLTNLIFEVDEALNKKKGCSCRFSRGVRGF